HEALASGLVDRVVPPDQLIAAARELVLALAAGRRELPAQGAAARRPVKRLPARRSASLLHECLRLPLVLDVVLSRARSQALAGTRGNYPAVPRAIDAVGAWARRGRAAGERAAAAAFADLLFTPQ